MCIESAMKWILIIVNVVFTLLGIALMALGISLNLTVNEVTELLPVILWNLSVFVIVLGAVVFVISYLACYGAYKESSCMLIFYAIAMAALAAAKLYLAIVIFGFLGDVNTIVGGWLDDAFGNQSLAPAYNALETLFRCCGTTGADSYAPTAIPASCCEFPVNNVCQAGDSYAGCTATLDDYFELWGGAIAGVLIAIVSFELLCVFFGVFLACVISRRSFK